MIRDRVRLSIEAGVASVVLARPEKRNGLDPAMFEAIIEAGERLAGAATVRAVVLSGEGKAFCAGLDFPAFMALPNAKDVLLARDPGVSPANLAQRTAWIWQEVPAPVIAAVHGVAFGGGLQIALGADIRYATADARLSVMEIRYGLIPDMGITQTLPGVVRADVARELTFTGREVSGTEAAALGLVTRVVEDPLAEAMATAREIAGRSPHAVRAAKAMLRDAAGRSRPDALALETELQLPLLGSANQLEAVAASMMKRDPSFADPDPE